MVSFTVKLEMREVREKPSERNPHLQWQTVSKRKRKNHSPQALLTCFVNYLPLSITSLEIEKNFRTHGYIDFIYIPMTNKPKNYKCAFVKYKYPQSLPSAIRDENGKKLGHLQITVFPAKYDKNLPPQTYHHPHHTHQPLKNRPPTNPAGPNNRNARRDQRSYKEVTLPSIDKNHHGTPAIQKPIQHVFPFDESPLQKPKLTLPQPTNHRIMCSRALGEDTENVRKTLGAIDIDGDYIAALKGKKSEEKSEMLQRSVVAVAISSQPSEAILDGILAQGVNSMSIKSMGGILHLITFVSQEEKQAMIDSKWLDQWFISLHDANEQSSSLWRETWLNIYGTPLMAWSYDNFYNIGCIFGRVLSVNYQNLDCAHVLVITDCLFEINGKVALEMDDMQYPVFVSENKDRWKDLSPGRKTGGMSGYGNVSPQSNPDPKSPMVNCDRTIHGSPITSHAKDKQPQLLDNDVENITPSKTNQPKPQKLTTFSTPPEPPLIIDTYPINAQQKNQQSTTNQIITLYEVTGSCRHTPASLHNGPAPIGPKKILFSDKSPKKKIPTPSKCQNKPCPPTPKPNSIIPTSNKYGPLL